MVGFVALDSIRARSNLKDTVFATVTVARGTIFDPHLA